MRYLKERRDSMKHLLNRRALIIYWGLVSVYLIQQSRIGRGGEIPKYIKQFWEWHLKKSTPKRIIKALQKI